ncbi:MAG: lyase family protein [Planctomycetota bacterium]
MTPSPPHTTSPDAQRLWDKGADLDALVHRFTVGDDPAWDLHLVHWDCLGSAAHARTLARASLLTEAELDALLRGLAEIDALHRRGEFAIPPELEDCHTAIEAHLRRFCHRGAPAGAAAERTVVADAGEKIHAGRSRNDQVATALRLFMRHHALDWLDLLDGFIASCLTRIERDGDVPMPGYTHMQPAMPSSVGQWLHAHLEAGLEQIRATLDLLDRLDACPLGTGAGFGVPLPLDREYTAALLGFRRAQRSPIDVQNSRGRLEKYFARVAADIAAFLGKLAADLLLFTTAEFGFFSLPDELTTGSSLMPQKRNPDVLELLRAHAGRAAARVIEIELICGKLPSSYHRDLQMTKPPAIRAALDTTDVLRVATRVLGGLQIHRERLAAAMRPELYATHATLARTAAGTPFRQVYRDVAAEVAAGRFDERAAAEFRPAAGRVDPADLAAFTTDLAATRAQVNAWRTRINAAEDTVLRTQDQKHGDTEKRGAHGAE